MLGQPAKNKEHIPFFSIVLDVSISQFLVSFTLVRFFVYRDRLLVIPLHSVTATHWLHNPKVTGSISESSEFGHRYRIRFPGIPTIRRTGL